MIPKLLRLLFPHVSMIHYDFSNAFPRFSYGFPIFSYVFPLLFVFVSYAFTMVNLWFSNGFPLLFHFITDAFPMVSYGFLWFPYFFEAGWFWSGRPKYFVLDFRYLVVVLALEWQWSHTVIRKKRNLHNYIFTHT